jgi:hypothetical protein
MPRTGTLFGAEEDATPLRRWKGLLATAALLAVLSAAAFLTREYWMPRPRVALMASSDRTARIWVLWNGEALGDVDHGALVIDTGDGPLHTIHLDRAQLRAGVLGYDCQPGRATATLLAGDTGESVTLTVRAEAHLPDSGISK